VDDIRIVVAYRLSTNREANCINVMEEGQVAQSGTFEELTAKKGLFRCMIARQLA
jgi:ABC-type multidrug transport system fused ATPase/permease subunit